MTAAELTQSIVHELLLYDPYTGSLTWRKRDRRWFKSDADCNAWNAAFAGSPAFTAPIGEGYLQGGILGKHYRAHRIIWLWMTGAWPAKQIDHKNRKPADNRWCNLREATNQENGRNQSMYRTNTSGRIGIRRAAYGQKWRACIGVGGGDILHLGTFSSFAEAANAREMAERRYGYSPGHGRRSLKALDGILAGQNNNDCC
jgi:hypothetical protein